MGAQRTPAATACVLCVTKFQEVRIRLAAVVRDIDQLLQELTHPDLDALNIRLPF
jgi:hypothetical protein